MVSVFTTLAVSTVAFASAVNGLTAATPSCLAVGEYFRPTGAQVSGEVTATTEYVRSPCPALNALANHGYLPRDGKNITRAMFKEAIFKVYNVGPDIGDLITNNIPEVISLAGLSEHNLVEHDASLARADASFKRDPATLDQELWKDLLSRAKNGQLGISELASARKDRKKRCDTKPTGCDFGLKQRFLAFAEAALMMRGLGGKNEESISVEYATSFFMDERIPASYKRPTSEINLPGALLTAAKVQALALF